MANYYIKITTDLQGSETMYWQEDYQNWTIDAANRTEYTSKAKADTALGILPKDGISASGITTAIKI